ncbi:Uncharacterized protein APZ42_012173 [Daphnia magna]|uniref:Uncharacterized protein n=1 Tax=Daphnia magna TaxID=35525 RepID=A0A162S5B4_9CRUS|nr:Uncharacterized protein APZ42_012173 [Daphnia magna]
MTWLQFSVPASSFSPLSRSPPVVTTCDGFPQTFLQNSYPFFFNFFFFFAIGFVSLLFLRRPFSFIFLVLKKRNVSF